MKITRVASPAMVKEVTTNPTAAADARARAIAKLEGSAPAVEAPVTQETQAPVPSPTEAPSAQPEVVQSATEASPEQVAQTENQVNQETSQAPTTEEPKTQEDPQLTAKLQQLAKRERLARMKIQQQEQALKAKEAEIAAKEAALAAKEKELDPTQYISKQRLKQNPLDVFAETDLTYEQITEQYLQQPGKNPQTEAAIRNLAEENKRLQQAIEEIKNSQKQAEETQYKQALTQLEKDTEKLVKASDNFELIRNSGSETIKEVVKLIEQTYKEEGYVMSVQEAAELVEKELEDRTIKFFEKTNKLKQRLAPKTTPAPQPSAATQAATVQTDAKAQQTQPMKTLTNANSTTRQLTARERAILAFEGRLKS